MKFPLFLFILCTTIALNHGTLQVYALSRDGGVPFSSIWRKVHPKHKVPSNAVWLCAAICILLGLPILKVNVVFTAITSICTIGWVGCYAVPIFARMVMAEKNFKAGPFYLGKASRPICLVAFLWICYTCSVFLLPTFYPITWNTFNYAPVAVGVGLGLIMLWWVLDARKWFKGPVRNIDSPNGKLWLLSHVGTCLSQWTLFVACFTGMFLVTYFVWPKTELRTTFLVNVNLILPIWDY